MRGAARPRGVARRVVLVRAALAIAALTGGLFLLARELEPVRASDGADGQRASRLYWSSVALALGAFAVVSFVVGSYIMLRAGRAFRPERERPERTPYVDAWTQYRVSERDIREATAEEPEPDEPEK